MRYTVSPSAQRDLNEIAEWILEDSPRRAVRTIRELRAAFDSIAQHPMLYRLRPDIGAEVRLSTVGHHVILFWIDGDSNGDIVRFERVVYGSRNLPSLYQ